MEIEQRATQLSCVQTIWRARSSRAGMLLGKADSRWGLTVLRYRGATQVSLMGPTTRAQAIGYAPGMEFFGVCFQLGVFLPHHRPAGMVNRTMVLPHASPRSFWLNDTACPCPDYDNVEAFVERLLAQQLLVRDRVVEAALAGETPALTPRSVQRHFLHATGLPHTTIAAIERARAAAAQLEGGAAILDVVGAAGYADQAHLTNTFRRLIGRTPAQVTGLKPSEHMSF